MRKGATTARPVDGAGGAVCVLVRVWLAARPGALGAVASRIGAVRGDIVGIDVLERGDGVAVDEFEILLARADLIPLLVREVEEVDGTRVEHVTVVDHFPDPRLDALTSVAAVCGADGPTALRSALTTCAGRTFLADWVALVDDGELVTWGDAPAEAYLLALAGGAAHSPAVADGSSGPHDLATAQLARRGAVLLVSRSGNEFRARERAQLRALTRIADHVWGRLEQTSPMAAAVAS
jgi:hypothetical protein